jgi:hypothetical protein
MTKETNSSRPKATKIDTISLLTEEQKLELVAKYTAGESVKNLLQEYSIERKDFTEFRKLHNLNLRYKEPSIKTQQDIKALLSDYYSGRYKVSEIIQKWKISTATLYQYVKAYASIDDDSNGLNKPHLSNYKKKKEQKKEQSKEKQVKSK